MQWSYGFAPNKQQQQQLQYGWNTTSPDYYSYISKIERTPSVLNEVPHYPSVHKAFNNRSTYGDQEQESTRHDEAVQQQKKSSPKAKAQKKVQVSERVEIVEPAKDDDDKEPAKDDDDKNCDVSEVDVQAAGFIGRKHKGFELCKWKTFNY